MFSVRSDLVEIGISEDGEMITGLCFYLVFEMSDGRRFAHFKNFVDTERVVSDDCCWFKKLPAEEAALQLLGVVESTAEGINPKYWHEIEPAYGSIAYQRWESQATQAELGYGGLAHD